MYAIRAALRAVTLSTLVAFPLSAQGIDLTVDHVGIGEVPRVIGLRLDFRDRALERVDGVNVTIWSPTDNGGRGVVNGLALGLPVTGAANIDGVGLFGVSTRERLRGIGVGGLGIGGNDLQGVMVGGLGAGAGHDITGIVVGGLGAGAGDVRGLAIGIVNYAEELHGAQIGLVNIARNNPPGTRVLPILNVHRGD